MSLSGPSLDGPVDLVALLRRGLEAYPEAPALVSAESRWTWAGLDDASSRYAAQLLGLGLEPGDRVATLMPNRGALLVHYIACMKAGLVSTPLNYRYMAPEIDHALEVSGASILLAHAERDEDLSRSKRVPQLPLGVIGYGASDGRSPTFEDLIEGKPPQLELPSPKPSDPAVIFFTSGSTGPAKGVTHSFETLGWMFASVIAGFELTARDSMLPGSSISHIGSLIWSFAALAVGNLVIVPRTFDGDEILRLLREYRPTIMAMHPAYLLRLVRDHDAHRADFASVRLCRSGGDKVPAELAHEFADLTGLDIDESYGMTEVGLATLNPPSGVLKVGSIGRALPGFTLAIRDKDRKDLGPGEEGRLWIKSKSNTIGYWGQPEATKATIRDGWLDSGDVMMADEDGYLWFRGRQKQIIVHDSSNICPQEVEEALLDHHAIQSAGVVGVRDLVHGENVRAYVSLRDGAKRPTGHELIVFARERVGYKAPEEIVFLDDIPLNPTGKVDRVTLKRMAEATLHGDP